MPLKDFVNGFEFPEGFDAAAFRESLIKEYDDDFATPQAVIDKLTGERDAAFDTTTKLRAHNYELLMKIPSGDKPEDKPGDKPDSTDEGPTIESLFGGTN